MSIQIHIFLDYGRSITQNYIKVAKRTGKQHIALGFLSFLCIEIHIFAWEGA